jgi:hypothetical protein
MKTRIITYFVAIALYLAPLLAFGQMPPLPNITSLSPSSTSATGQAFQIRIEGTGFVDEPFVSLNHVACTSDTHLTVNVPASANRINYVSALEIFSEKIYYGRRIFPINSAVPLPRPIITGVRQINNFLYIAGMHFMTGATISIPWESNRRGFVFRIQIISVTPTEIITLSPSTTAVISASNGYGGIYLVNPDGQFAGWSFPTDILTNHSFKFTRLYPNPTNETTTIETNTNAPSQATFILRNALGQELTSFTKALPSGQVFTPLDMHSFPAGMYFLEVQSGTERVVERLVKH